jgi:hypothetical protein|nr:MAG TPA: hypothetical protein [Bacteriophage sp.]
MMKPVKLFYIHCPGMDGNNGLSVYTYSSALMSEIVDMIDKTDKVTAEYINFNESTVPIYFRPALNGVPNRYHLQDVWFNSGKYDDQSKYVIRILDKFHYNKDLIGFKTKEEFLNKLHQYHAILGYTLAELKVDDWDKTVVLAKVFTDTFDTDEIQDIYTNKEDIQQQIDLLSTQVISHDDIIRKTEQFITKRKIDAVKVYTFGGEGLTLKNFSRKAKEFLREIRDYNEHHCVYYKYHDGVLTMKFERDHGSVFYTMNKVVDDVLHILGILTKSIE